MRELIQICPASYHDASERLAHDGKDMNVHIRCCTEVQTGTFRIS